MTSKDELFEEITTVEDVAEKEAESEDVASEKSGSETEREEESATKIPSVSEEAEDFYDIEIEVDMVSVVNYALHHNNIPILQGIKIHNKSLAPLENMQVTITSVPEVFLPYSFSVDFIPEEKTYDIKNIPITPNAEFLAGLTEKIKGHLTVTLSKDEKTVAENVAEFTSLAFDEWHGYGYFPELLTSFVTPNHPAIVKIIARAANLLGTWTGDPSMDAYQTQDANRVLNQAAAIFSAIKEENIVYSVPPASFEQVGQRVRLCDTVLEQKFGTCLDLTLLYASCLEAVGLHPIMILTNGHIMSGVWLDELSFPEAVQDDSTLVTKRLASGVNELAVIETTMVVSGKNASFDDACKHAEHSLTGTEPIECIIDVHRARISGIAPLPHRIRTDDGWHIEYDTTGIDSRDTAPKGLDSKVDISAVEAAETEPKIIQWERKLLDLGLKNNLINLRPSKNLVPILAPSLDELENALADGSDFSVLEKPADWQAQSKEQIFEKNHDLGAFSEVITSEFLNKRLRSTMTEAELGTTIKNLYRTSKASLEENGANTLYLALGILRWYETPKSRKPRYAPLVLIPVEIIRKSASKGFIIRLRDEDAQMNITVLEKIKQDFKINITGVDPLPADEHGVDLRKVFTILRKAIMEQNRWDILESAYLGIFSFSQFVMWNDLRNRTEDLLKNKVVKSLVDGKLSWEAEPMEMGDKVSESDVLLPMPADASQLYAIESACRGESFVLHGPPGTGKSQTITSLIANALAQGKSVLFVAEKMAALEVVQKRLENIGIGPFCLEIHSNKAKKRAVLEQLRRVTEITKHRTPEEFAAKAEHIATLRADLDSYAQELHRLLPCGYDLHELICEYETLRDEESPCTFTNEFANTLSRLDLDGHITVLERLIAAAKEIGHPYAHPLSCIGLTSYNQQLKVDLPVAVNEYMHALTDISDTAQGFAQTVSYGNILSFADMENLFAIATELKRWMEFPKEWAKVEDLGQYLGEIKKMAVHFIRANNSRKRLLADWNKTFFDQDGAALLKEYSEISTKWFVARHMALSQFARKLSVFARTKVDKDSLPDALNTLCEYRKDFDIAQNLLEKHGSAFVDAPVSDNKYWDKITLMASDAITSDILLCSICGDSRIRTAYCGEEALIPKAELFIEKFRTLKAAKDTCYNLLAISEASSDSYWISQQAEMCDEILDNKEHLKEWISFNEICAEANSKGLTCVTDAYRSGLDHGRVILSYKKAMLHTIITGAIDSSETLNSFSGVVFNEKIEQLKRIDSELISLSQKEIYCRLASRVPNFVASAAHSSELGILQRMIKSNGRGTSIRKLFEDISNLLPRLCPCMLMSPISAAQYLDPKREPFDIVVFDEASQLPTCKAVGVLARGKDAVIVGDPKQMPPTSFFATNTVDEDNLDIEDLESILDDCLALNMPQTHLLWHYRSRHESLIAFSNSHFYENKLFTFPSVNDREKRVSTVYVDGVFQRGKTRSNKEEAEAIVAEILRRYRDEELRKLSLGVVTFNISQQHLIDDLLAEAASEDPEFEKWAYESEEPLFIKNLENVQGDERDVILFSIGYGPDETGKVSMNFGPLNRDGGFRRLNVAVSRSRQEMIVFSTLRPEQINLSRTSSQGVAALKAFLEYASGKELPVDVNTSTGLRRSKNGIINAIGTALEARGYKYEVCVGHSEYRIDIGVVHPEDSEKYILGILLDGASYGSSKTTRDREIAQISVLTGLGWNIHRIWTMDWWDNAQKEIEKIFARIDALLSGKQTDTISDESVDISDESADEGVVDTPEEEKPPCAQVVPYTCAQLINKHISADEFVSGLYVAEITKTIEKVLQAEAPISHSLLTKRVVQSFGITRAGSRIQDFLNRILDGNAYLTTTYGGELFYWAKGQSPDTYNTVRTAGDSDFKREASDIPVDEAMCALYYILEQQISLAESDLIREAGKLMGYSRASAQLCELFQNAITVAKALGKISTGANGNLILL